MIRCMDCGRDTGARGLKEYPLMLRDDVWLSITADTAGAGVLCRADIERRLGRSLLEGDMMVDGHETPMMIERVARALFNRRYPPGEGVARRWDGLPDAERAGWRADAYAAITALLEPTEAMLAAGLDNYEFGGRTRAHVRHDWQAMIDAALQ